MTRHPDTLRTAAAPPRLDPAHDALFLDFDGTLVAIAPTPDAVIVPPALAPLLTALSARLGGALALVSGRALDEIAGFLPGYGGPAIGSHGAEARGLPGLAGGGVGPRDLAALHDRFRAFAAAEGLLFEPKPHGAAIHFRARPEAEARARAFVTEVLAGEPGLALQTAKMAFELRPEGATKDAALRAAVAAAPFAGRRPVYLGDDTTDEPAIAWAGSSGGIGVKVGDGDSAARHRLSGPAEVLGWLCAQAAEPAPGGGPGGGPDGREDG
ncbi:trehalose-phosphatase [Frigidibacter sp. MR17.24]|uniref:trehalose-phosphatase n=1 Tax=Frigidibacter sp. MR17.24 TaxID=3127345 RepID=UPI0030130A76